MQNVSARLYQILLSSQRDLAPVDCFEFYPPGVVDLIPANAERRFASTTLVWYGWEYEQQAVSRSDISRYMTEKFNGVTVTLSNVDLRVSQWLNEVDLEGYRLVIRSVSRSIDNDSLVLFVGRCEKPGDIENAQVTISAKQDLGTIENELPFSRYDLKCPLKFQGSECLGGQQLTDKTQSYRTATECNKSFSQCFEYGNHKAFQGFRYRAVVGSYRVNSRPAGIAGVFGSRKATKQWTSTDNVPVGQSVPLGLGRTQIDLMPVLYADTGKFLYGHFVAGEGPITEFADVRNTTAGWATSFQFLAKHNGDYGFDTDQETDSQLLGQEYYSHRAYVEATIEGNNPDAGDPAPTLAGLVLWQKMPTVGTTGFDAEDWSDNPVEHVRYLLTEPRALAYPESWIDDNVALETAQYCNEPLPDTSGCEEFWYDQNQGTAGTDWKRYRSTGVLDSAYYKYVLNPVDANRPQKLGAEYNSYDPEAPPESIVPQTFYRKRYTSNWHLKEPVKVSDFLFKHLLPSFRGYLLTGADGRLQIKSERPAISSFIRNASSPGDTSIAIEDALQWQRLQLNQLYVLVGAGQDTSETRRVVGIEYSTAGNSLTLATTQGATAYSATFQGGSASTQAWNYLTVDGTNPEVPVIVTIDGTTITAGGYDATGAIPTNGAVAGELAARINANATLSRYIEAIWSKSNPTIVTLKSKLGFLLLDEGLTYSHDTLEKTVHVHAVFADAALGALAQSNIIRDSFKYPLGSRQTSYNQFAITYTDSTQDFQQTELRENDYDHQERLNKINKLEISGACVDNYHQADRLVQAARYKYRDGDFFCSFQAVGDALLLEEGDIICVNHANMPGKRNQLFRVEELRISQDHRITITARLYAEEQFPSAAKVRTVGLNTGTVWIAGTPPAVTGVTVNYTTIDSGRVEFDFGEFVGGQTARIEIKRGGVGDWLPVLSASPDGLGRGAAEIPALTVGTKIRITPVSSTGVEGTPTEITVTSPLYVWPASYPASSGYVLSSTTGGVLSWVEQTGGGGGNAFGTVAVSGQSDVVADQANDTLTLVAGSNITLTTNSTNDSVTIASTAAGVTDGDKGDIVVSESGSKWDIEANAVTTTKILDGAVTTAKIPDQAITNQKINNGSVTSSKIGDSAVSTAKIVGGAVTYAKMQNVSAASRLLGRGSASGSGDVEEISLGVGLAMSGTTIATLTPFVAVSIVDVTTSDISAQVNIRYFVTIKDMTASRNFVLPAPTSVSLGDQIQVLILDDNANYELIIKGASGVTINNGTAAAEWSRLFIKNETVTFIATTSTNWQVLVDGRIPCKVYASSPGTNINKTISSVDTTNRTITYSSPHGLSNGDAIYFIGANPPVSSAVIGAPVQNRTVVLFVTLNSTNPTTTIKLTTTAAKVGSATSTDYQATVNSTTAATYQAPVIASGTMSTLTLDNIALNVGAIAVSSTQIKVRRTGAYIIGAGAIWSDGLSPVASTFHDLQILCGQANGNGSGDATTYAPFYQFANQVGAFRPGIALSGLVQATAGNSMYFGGRHYKGITQSWDYRLTDPFVSVSEVF